MPVSVLTTLDLEDVEALFQFNDKDRAEFIVGQFNQLSELDRRKLLAGFCTGDREDFNDDHCIMGTSFDEDFDDEGDRVHSGCIYVCFTGSAYYGCKDMDRVDEHEVTITFWCEPSIPGLWFETSPPPPISERYDEI